MKNAKIHFIMIFIIILGFTLNSSVASVQVVYNWTKLSTTLPFRDRGYSNTAVYDSESDTLLFFENGDGTTDLVTTWGYNYSTQTWTNYSTAGFVRQAAPVAYDSESDVAILFAGNHYNPVIIGQYVCKTDTWAYDFNSDTWTNMTATMTGPSPPSRAWLDMVYDIESDRIIVFGGRDLTEGLGSVVNRDDTWAYDYNSNTWEEKNPSNHPGNGWQHALAYDNESDRIILQGGYTDGANYDETWAYDYNTDTWTEMNPTPNPGFREIASMDYNPITDQCVLFGGGNSGGYPNPYGDGFNDMWVYDYNNNNWTELILYESPGGRSSHDLVYNSKEDIMVLFGGWSGETKDTTHYDMWIFDYETTTAVPPTSTTTTTETTTTTVDTPSMIITPLFLIFLGIIVINRRQKK